MARFGSLFAGVGGFDLGLEAAGWECGWQVEWDTHAQQVLAYHWPDVPRWGDVRDVDGATLPPVELITFGSPCQDLSLAGKRKGLAGERSGLFYEAIRIIEGMRSATSNRFPQWAVWENVPGAYSSNAGRDFGAVLDGLAGAGALVIEWATVDSRHWVPQRRKRVFVAACFDTATSERCPDPLLPIGQGVCRNHQQGQQAWQDAASAPADSPAAGVWGFSAVSNVPDAAHQCAPTLRMTSLPAVWAGGLTADNDAAPTLLGRKHTSDIEGTYVVAANETGTLSPGAHPGGLNGQDAYTGQPVATLPYVKVVRSGERDADGNLPPEVWRVEPVAPTLNLSDMGESRSTTLAAGPTGVRRLTPVECERLMGWPDNHTLMRADGKRQADSNRYRQCGNGVVAPVAQWIGTHILNTLRGN